MSIEASPLKQFHHLTPWKKLRFRLRVETPSHCASLSDHQRRQWISITPLICLSGPGVLCASKHGARRMRILVIGADTRKVEA